MPQLYLCLTSWVLVNVFETSVFMILATWLFAIITDKVLFEKKLKAVRQRTPKANRSMCESLSQCSDENSLP